MYQDQLPSTPDLLDEGQLMADAYNVLDKTRTIDLYSVLTSAQSENLYYTTDNRLTGYGSYLCYRSLIRALGQSSLGLESFDIRHVANGIYGNLYRRTMIPTARGTLWTNTAAKPGVRSRRWICSTTDTLRSPNPCISRNT